MKSDFFKLNLWCIICIIMKNKNFKSMENKKIEKKEMDLYFRLRRPISYATALAMVGHQIERYTEYKKREFEHSNFLRKMLCYPDTYRWIMKVHPIEKRKMRISLVHDVHKELVFNLYKGDIHDNFDLYFDEEETAYSILLKPVDVKDIDWKKKQNHFLFEFCPYLYREVKLRSLEIENPLDVISRAQRRAIENLYSSYKSFLRELSYSRLGRRILRDILWMSLLIII